MSLIKNISSRILKRSNSYNYYKRNYKTASNKLISLNDINFSQKIQIENLKKTNLEQKKYIEKLEHIQIENFKKTNLEQKKYIEKLEHTNITKDNEIKLIEKDLSKYKELYKIQNKEKEYYTSLSKFEIENIEKYLFELIELVKSLKHDE